MPSVTPASMPSVTFVYAFGNTLQRQIAIGIIKSRIKVSESGEKMRFFEEAQRLKADKIVIDGENGRHISRSLRMHVGEEVELCDGDGEVLLCEIESIDGDMVTVAVKSRETDKSESKTKITLYQCLPKSDKLEVIVQKATELGVFKIVPTISERCIAKIDGKAEKKLARLKKIALEAAKQSRRGIVPEIGEPIKLSKALEQASGTKLFLYEGGGKALKVLLDKADDEIAVFVGPEGGFSENEVELAKKSGAEIVGLGRRILRTETAPIAAVAIIMYEKGEME